LSGSINVINSPNTFEMFPTLVSRRLNIQRQLGMVSA
jgi:hypothetical protein